jgi:Zn-dependent M28 family amino/carboxypeptidase
LQGETLIIRNPQSAIRKLLLPLIAVLTFACGSNGAAPRPAGESTPAASAEAEPKKKTTAFDGAQALNHVKALIAFGPRPAGSAALEKTREYLVKELKSYGLQTSFDEFAPVTPQGKVTMKNVIAELPGETGDLIIISSHYDTKSFKEFSFVGANDGGSSTGALLEIARVLSSDKQKRKFTYQFVFFDGEEAFCREWSECLDNKDHTYGSRHMAERLRDAKQTERVKALILLDMIGDKDLSIPKEQTSSAWLVQAIWETAQEAGYGKHFPNRWNSIEDDHVRFLEVGIPAVDLIDFEYGGPDNPHWHNKNDTLDKISAQSLKIVGDVVILSLPKIEAQAR